MDLHEIFLASQIAGKSNGGDENVDLSDYYTKSQISNLLSGKVNKVTGMGLSTNDFTNALKTKLDNLSNYDDTDVKANIAKMAEQTALNRSTLGYQRKNLLMNNCSSKTINGVISTTNADGSVTLSGTNSLGKDFVLFVNLSTGLNNQFENNKKFIPNGKYIVSGGVSGCGVQIVVSEDNTAPTTKTLAISHGSDVAFTIDDSHKYVWFRLLVRSGASFSETETIYPMVRLADVKNDTYEPYKPSVEEYISELSNKKYLDEQSIPSGADLNDYISENFQVYCTGSQAITQTILNKPAEVNDNRFTLETWKNGSYNYIQRLTHCAYSTARPPVIYIRSCSGGSSSAPDLTWSDWYKFEPVKV